VSDLMASGELPPQEHDYSVYDEPSSVGDFRFCMLRKALTPESDLLHIDHYVMTLKYAIRRICGSPQQWFGLENSSTLIEYVPLFVRRRQASHLDRVCAVVPTAVASVANEAVDDAAAGADPTAAEPLPEDIDLEEDEAEDEADEDLFSEGLPSSVEEGE